MTKFGLREFGRRYWAREDRASGDRLAQASLEAIRREHAILQAELLGAQAHMGQFPWNRGALFLTRSMKKRLRNLLEESTEPCLLIDPRPGLHIIDGNDAFAAATLCNRRRIVGGKLFAEFPDNPAIPEANGISNLFDSFRKCAQEKRMHAPGIQRYDVRDADGGFLERYWRPVNVPILDEAGHLIYLLNRTGPIPPS